MSVQDEIAALLKAQAAPSQSSAPVPETLDVSVPSQSQSLSRPATHEELGDLRSQIRAGTEEAVQLARRMLTGVVHTAEGALEIPPREMLGAAKLLAGVGLKLAEQDMQAERDRKKDEISEGRLKVLKAQTLARLIHLARTS